MLSIRLALTISIHSPRARGDVRPLDKLLVRISISIHSPRARGDLPMYAKRRHATDFNPLPSCEGRPNAPHKPIPISKISIHSPRARGDILIFLLIYKEGISIHSPHVRGDRLCLTGGELGIYFNPLPSCEGRPQGRGGNGDKMGISIHSPHVRGDQRPRGRPAKEDISIHSPHVRGDAQTQTSTGHTLDFNPLPSCEGRLRPGVSSLLFFAFQSTPLM